MNKYILVFLVMIVSSLGFADNYIDVMPLQLQYRFEDTTNQSKDYVRYETYGVAIQAEKFRLGFEAARHTDRTGNASLNVETLKKDFLFTGGYEVYRIQNKGSVWHVAIFGNVIAGVNQTEVQTVLLNSSENSMADQNGVYGLGTSAVFRASYFMMEAEVKALNSKGFSPSTVFSSQLKLGLTFSI